MRVFAVVAVALRLACLVRGCVGRALRSLGGSPDESARELDKSGRSRPATLGSFAWVLVQRKDGGFDRLVRDTEGRHDGAADFATLNLLSPVSLHPTARQHVRPLHPRHHARLPLSQGRPRARGIPRARAQGARARGGPHQGCRCWTLSHGCPLLLHAGADSAGRRVHPRPRRRRPPRPPRLLRPPLHQDGQAVRGALPQPVPVQGPRRVPVLRLGPRERVPGSHEGVVRVGPGRDVGRVRQVRVEGSGGGSRGGVGRGRGGGHRRRADALARRHRRRRRQEGRRGARDRLRRPGAERDPSGKAPRRHRDRDGQEARGAGAGEKGGGEPRGGERGAAGVPEGQGDGGGRGAGLRCGARDDQPWAERHRAEGTGGQRRRGGPWDRDQLHSHDVPGRPAPHLHLGNRRRTPRRPRRRRRGPHQAGGAARAAQGRAQGVPPAGKVRADGEGGVRALRRGGRKSGQMRGVPAWLCEIFRAQVGSNLSPR